jgi:phenylalanyl-tRNA synthetase alpha chain
MSKLSSQIIDIKNAALAQIMDAKNASGLEEIRVAYLGRKGKLNNLIKKIKELSAEEKKQVGVLINDTKNTISNALVEKKAELSTKVSTKEWFDISVPGKKPAVGNLHAQTKVLTEIINIFTYLGYQVTDGPEIETDYYNFEALNIPKDHPARDTQQTLYIDTANSKVKFGELILRTQTSAMQGRVMKKMEPPFRILVPGTNYRYEQVDASHGFQFHQVEGFVVDENIHLTDLFGTIEFVLQKLFGDEAKIRFATTNFPFVEPGVDTYLQCTICNGKGCKFCKKTGWSEIMPAGMIHPFVLKTAGIDTKKWGGFAFAIGSSRVVSLKYQINDLRILTDPDIRILSQF